MDPVGIQGRCGSEHDCKAYDLLGLHPCQRIYPNALEFAASLAQGDVKRPDVVPTLLFDFLADARKQIWTDRCAQDRDQSGRAGNIPLQFGHH